MGDPDLPKSRGGRVGRRPKLAEVRSRFWNARASGATLREAAAAAGMSRSAGHLWLHESGGLRPRPTRPRSPLRLVTRGTRGDLPRPGQGLDADGHRGPAQPVDVDGLSRGDAQQQRAPRAPRASASRRPRSGPLPAGRTSSAPRPSSRGSYRRHIGAAAPTAVTGTRLCALRPGPAPARSTGRRRRRRPSRSPC